MHAYRRRTLFPTEKSELIRLYTFSEQDLSVIKQRVAMPIALALLFCFALWGILATRCRQVSGPRIPF